MGLSLVELKVVTSKQVLEEKTLEHSGELVGSASQQDMDETEQRHKILVEMALYELLEGDSGQELAIQEVWLLVNVVAGARSLLQTLESLARDPVNNDHTCTRADNNSSVQCVPPPVAAGYR